MSQYLSPRKLYCEIIVSKAQGRLTKEAENMIILLCKRTLNKFRYYDLKDKDDCFQQGVYDIFKNWYLFNEDRSSNAFAYYTEIFKRGAAYGLNQIYKKKGIEGGYLKVYSINSINDGEGMHNIL